MSVIYRHNAFNRISRCGNIWYSGRYMKHPSYSTLQPCLLSNVRSITYVFSILVKIYVRVYIRSILVSILSPRGEREIERERGDLELYKSRIKQ